MSLTTQHKPHTHTFEPHTTHTLTMSMLNTKYYDMIPYYRKNLGEIGESKHGYRGVSAQFQPPTYANGGVVEGVIVERQVLYWAYKKTACFSGETLKKLSSTVTGLCVGGWNGAHVGLPTHVVFPGDWMEDHPWRAEVRCFATFIPSKKDPFSPCPSEAPSAICERLGLSASEDTFATHALEEYIDPSTGQITPLHFERQDIRWQGPWNPAQPRWELLRTFSFEQNYNSTCCISVSNKSQSHGHFVIRNSLTFSIPFLHTGNAARSKRVRVFQWLASRGFL